MTVPVSHCAGKDV